MSVARMRRTRVYLSSVGTPYGEHVSDINGQTQDPNAWAALLRDITSRPGWSVAKLARDSGIHRSTIFRWINGEMSNLTLDSIRLVAEAANIDIRDTLRAAATLIMQTSPTAAVDRRFVDPLSGEVFTDPIEQALWDLRSLPEETRRGLVAYVRADRALRRRRVN